MRNVKIFVPYHRRAPLFKNKIMEPIHVGRALVDKTKDGEISYKDRKWLIENMIGDDTEDNISYLNREFCETSALYWAWRHLEQLQCCEYIGFMQYRRHFIFNSFVFQNHRKDTEKEAYGCIHVRIRSVEKYVNSIGLTEEKIIGCIEDNPEGVLPIAGNLAECGVSSLWDDYVQRIPGVHLDDLCAMVDVMKKEDITKGHLLEDYLNQTLKLMYQMFILPREEYIKYCGFLFKWLFNVRSHIDTRLYSPNGRRTIGYLAEILYGLYFLKISQKNFKNLGITFIEGI